MNRDILEGNWKEIRGEIRQRWGELTDDELEQINGQRDKLVGSLQKRYGYSRDEASRQLDDFLNDWERNRPNTRPSM